MNTTPSNRFAFVAAEWFDRERRRALAACTTIASHIVRGATSALQARLCVSVVTEGELLCGLARDARQPGASNPLCSRSQMRTAMLRAGSKGSSSKPKRAYKARSSSSSGWVSTQKQPTSLDRRTAVVRA